MTDGRYAVGIDIGGTKTDVALVDSGGRVLCRQLIKTRTTAGPEAILSDIFTATDGLLKRSEAPPSAIGIGLAGQIDALKGVVVFGPNLQWSDVPLRGPFEGRYGATTHLMNDVKAAAWAEWIHGAGRGCGDFVCLFIGTGLGGAIVAGGVFIEGASNTAGEWGHSILEYNGRLCSCGQRGCLESYVAGWGIALTAKQMVEERPHEGRLLLELAGGDIQALRAEHVAQALERDDALALHIYEDVAARLTAGCVTIVNALNPAKIILGGGIIYGFPQLTAHLAAALPRQALQAAVGPLQVVASALGHDAGVVGAATAALHRVEKKA